MKKLIILLCCCIVAIGSYFAFTYHTAKTQKATVINKNEWLGSYYIKLSTGNGTEYYKTSDQAIYNKYKQGQSVNIETSGNTIQAIK